MTGGLKGGEEAEGPPRAQHPRGDLLLLSGHVEFTGLGLLIITAGSFLWLFLEIGYADFSIRPVDIQTLGLDWLDATWSDLIFLRGRV